MKEKLPRKGKQMYWDVNLEFQMLVGLRNITNYLSDGTEFCIRERQTLNAFQLNNIGTLKKLCPKFNLRYRIIVKSKNKSESGKDFSTRFYQLKIGIFP